MTWGNSGPSRGAKHNRRVRGGGTWGEQLLRLYGHQEARYTREMGRGLWSERGRRLDRARRRRERGQPNLQRRTPLRRFGTAVAVGAVIVGAVLLMSRATRGTGLMILVLTGLVLYLVIGRKRA